MGAVAVAAGLLGALVNRWFGRRFAASAARMDGGAYYWMRRAKRGGMGNLERTMMQARSAWARGGYSRERANTSRCFPCEPGTVGYALLCIDARHNADAAEERLAECAPEFLA